VTLRLYDTATRDVRDFVPLSPGEVGIYLCGATVQAPPHVGHLRPAVAFDVLRRWLERKGLRVTLIRNVTDIDDKILAKAAAAGVEWWAHAAHYERVFTAAYDAVGILPPTYEPRATQHVPDMVTLMQRLVERGHAYSTGPGNVWFDVRSWPDYGDLTKQRLEDLNPEAADDEVASEKRDPHDFALWKAPKPGEPETAAWDTPFGRGRPGWHLECSAMAQRYLGGTFDIHGGGLDLRFPHHENEQAQSRAAGYGFAQRWMHSAWVTQQGVKMSKSLGNGLLVSDLLAQSPAVVVRYALASVQYRSMLEWGPDTLDEARATWERLAGFVERATERVGEVPAEEVGKAELPDDFTAAMDDDLNVPAALAVVHEHLRAGNTALAAKDDSAARAELVALRGMLDVLGLDPADPRWTTTADSRVAEALDALVRAELDARAAARAAKDWSTSDAIRDRLAAAGVVVQDSPDGARWSLDPH
jgi:cysteinyl-tRNA synthetase